MKVRHCIGEVRTASVGLMGAWSVRDTKDSEKRKTLTCQWRRRQNFNNIRRPDKKEARTLQLMVTPDGPDINCKKKKESFGK